MSQGQFIGTGLVVALIPLLILAHSPNKWWLAAILLANSGMLVPGLGRNLSLSMMASLGFIGLALLNRIFHRGQTDKGGASQRIAGFLVVLLVCLASYRGWGLQFFGSESWGGMRYIQLLGGLLYYYYSPQVRVGEESFKKVMLFYFWLVLLPAVVVILTPYVPALLSLSGIFGSEKMSDPMAGGVFRLQMLHIPATVLGWLCLLLFDRRMNFSWNLLGVGGLAFVLAGLSGHRAVLVQIGLAGLIYWIMRWRKIPFAIRLKGMVVGLLVLGSVYSFASALPLGFQRMVSVLPGIHVNPIAQQDAQGTSDWRIEMWRKMLPMIPQYAIIGRGVGFDLREAYGAYTLSSDRATQHEFFIATHLYHNGPLWALIDLGAIGAFLVLGFMGATLVRYGRRLAWTYAPFMGSVYVVFYAILASSFVFFMTTYGGLTTLIEMALFASILEVVSNQTQRSDTA